MWALAHHSCSGRNKAAQHLGDQGLPVVKADSKPEPSSGLCRVLPQAHSSPRAKCKCPDLPVANLHGVSQPGVSIWQSRLELLELLLDPLDDLSTERSLFNGGLDLVTFEMFVNIDFSHCSTSLGRGNSVSEFLFGHLNQV